MPDSPPRREAHQGAEWPTNTWATRRSREPLGGGEPVLVVCAHGTDDPDGRRVVEQIADTVRAARPVLSVHTAYVDVQRPDIGKVVDGLVARGQAVVVVPLLLSTGYHVQVDIERAVSRHPAAVSAPSLGPAPELAQVLRDRLLEAGAHPGEPVVLAAAGSSRAAAAGDVESQAEQLHGVWRGAVAVGYLAGNPSVAEALEAQAGAAIASYLIGRGFFQARLEQAAAGLIAQPLGSHPRLVDLVLRRFDEARASRTD